MNGRKNPLAPYYMEEKFIMEPSMETVACACPGRSGCELLDIDKFHFFSFGPGIGYAYTFVYKEHFFILGSASINLALHIFHRNFHHPGQKASRFGFQTELY